MVFWNYLLLFFFWTRNKQINNEAFFLKKKLCYCMLGDYFLGTVLWFTHWSIDLNVGELFSSKKKKKSNHWTAELPFKWEQSFTRWISKSSTQRFYTHCCFWYYVCSLILTHCVIILVYSDVNSVLQILRLSHTCILCLKGIQLLDYYLF